MNTSTSVDHSTNSGRIGDSVLARKLRANLQGEILFDAFSRGRYSTDASHYQIEPIGVVVPRTEQDVVSALQIAREENIPVLPRGAGTSQCGQSVGAALVIDVGKHLDALIELDSEARRAVVQPGIVLDRLNRQLKPHGLMFAVDVSTSSRATIGGMTGNNSCGARSIRYGTMRDNVAAIDALLIDGSAMHFGTTSADLAGSNRPTRELDLIRNLLALGRREAQEIKARFPDLMRRVGGYNIDALMPPRNPADALNLAHLLVGSEGTLAFSQRIHLDLQPIPQHKVLGICHFPTFYQAMDATRHIVELGPAAVELVDRTMLELARDIEVFRPTVERFVRGEPDALLLVEFAGDDRERQLRDLRALVELMDDLGFAGAVVEAVDPGFQAAVWEVRKSGLNIMMSMKGDGKPISFIEDCAVRLEDLAEYTDRLTQVFHKYGTSGTWYAHASVGCLHVRPIVNLKQQAGADTMRAIAEEAFAMVREYKGSHSGEHGDGLVRSEFHETMFGTRMTENFREVKTHFDPAGLMNPGKIVDAPKMDDRTLFRYKPGYQVIPIETALDWSAWGGFGGAVEMCNNNGACRKFQGGVMCPSFRVTRDEQHLTRGRANSLRLAISGQLGADAFSSEQMYETMQLCVGCKGCKRECPTGVDMARMKTEFLYHYRKRHGLRWHDRLIAYLPHYAPLASRFSGLLNLRDRLPGAALLSEKLGGFSARRPLPRWHREPFRPQQTVLGPQTGRDVVLLADTFNTWFEPDNLRAALKVLQAGGYRIHLPQPAAGDKPLCCGRTFLAAGLIDQARSEAQRLCDTLQPFVERGIPIVGLEPSCLLTLRDEFQVMLPAADTDALAAQALLFEEFLAGEHHVGTLQLPLQALGQSQVLLHGHCHQKAFDVMSSVDTVLGLIPGVQTSSVETSCCGMAGAFGYGADSYDISMKMAELNLLPAVRAAGEDTLIVADGTSCRHQIYDGSGRRALHVARVLERALP
jgi:FAD/FMN-containing dehydrogenase/Fe-S oxidoreductase